ncbi:MAG: DUF2924 domain-containing protein, partial [Betaproteobacteria bacterium]|nr:DUF2924 domain-containing protein [Betaproteobacteria bacterium]
MRMRIHQGEQYLLLHVFKWILNTVNVQALIAQSRRKDPRRKEGLAPGTMLTREYRGRTHIVDVLDDGTFAFEGRPYKSLSRIALEITGAAWSGPAFFGVRT